MTVFKPQMRQPVRSKFLYILDSGHGGLNPKTGNYVTPGKRSCKDDDGNTVLYEGVNNRDNVKRIIKGLEAVNLECIDIVNDWKDVTLGERVRRANELARGRKCVYISIHSDANGNGIQWNQASGIGTYVYKNGSFASQLMAKYMHQELSCNFEFVAKDRKIKKAGFYVLRNTSCPAVLLELGFHTHKEEVYKMQTEDWKKRVVRSVVGACQIFELNA